MLPSVNKFYSHSLNSLAMIFRKYFLYILLLQGSSSFSQCITLNGELKDQVLGNPIVANININSDGNKKNVGKSNEDGSFSINLDCNAKALIIDKAGYRTLIIPINGNNLAQKFYATLSLTPVDKQTKDKPYFQSEQKDLILNNSSANNGKQSIRYFKIIDVETKKPLNANVCLIYTKSGEKKCIDTQISSKGEKVIFSEEDIIALEVKAKGYQSYDGNLFISLLDNKSSIYEIGLSKTVSVLSLSTNTIPENKNYKLSVLDKSNNSLSLVKKDDGLFSTALSLNESYLITLEDKKGSKLFEQKLPSNEGLTFINITIPKDKIPIIAPIVQEKIENVKFDTLTIYFAQGEFVLENPAKKTLDSVSSYLNQNPSLKVEIVGSSDNVGDLRINQTISEFRAIVTKSYLNDKGVSENRLTYLGKGNRKPAFPNDSDENRKKNRRVDILIFKP